MQIAVISDLHLGPGGALDEFGHDDSDFLRFLTFLEQNFERVVLLGDIWETLTGALPGSAATELEAARRTHHEIAARFRTERYTYLHGNHDMIAGAIDGAPDELYVEADGMRLLFSHGHQGDPLVVRRRLLAELGIWLGGWIRRLGLAPLYRLCSAIDGFRGGASPDSSRCAFQREWVGLARKRQADIIVTGHTHIPTRGDHGTELFLNSGSCSEGRFNFASIDTKRGSYLVHSGF